MRFRLAAGTLLASIPLLSGAPEESLDPEQLAFFEKRVRPVLVENCYKCHSAEQKVKSGLRVDTREAIRSGGERGPAIVPGQPEKSLLISAIRHSDKDLKMPKNGKLSDRQIADLTKWVKMGAPDPRGEDAAPIELAEIDYEEGRKFWAFNPPVRKPAPEVKDAGWPRNEIDRHLLAAMEAKGLQPVPDADRLTLVRRLYFDLVGLPPTPAQLESFLADESPQAVESLVDELLTSPHFGERWGRHWLDVARFSESNGMERNFTYPHAWRYRDYVIASFNADKPYNQFVREQIAGDLLEGADESGSDPEERLIATAFLALGPKILNEGNKQIFQMEMVDEQIDATSRAVLGLTVSCARCHDHKFDPIGMKDYYALAGIFTSTRTLYGTKGGGGNRQGTDLMAIGDESEEDAARRKEYEQKLAATQKQLNAATKRFQNLKNGKGKPEKRKKRNPKNNAAKDQTKGERLTEMRAKMNTLKKEVAALRKDAPPAPDYAMGVAESGSPGDCRIRLRGDPKKLGPAVPRGYLGVIKLASAPEITNQSSGRRELAEWIVSEDNPLAARVMANRIWHHLFGAGIVRTVDNFGKMGEPPVNQDLLDHLAIRFMDGAWSVKGLIRELVLSRAYQLSGDHHDGNYERDPENRLCWQMSRKRLEAEAIRDAILLASGALDREPFAGSIVQSLGDINFGRGPNGFGDRLERVARHRSVYLPIIRNAVPEALRVFDFAEPSLIVGRRNITNVPTQALYLLNDPFVLESSELMAQRLLDDAADSESRIDLAYTLTLGRPATTLERERCHALLDDVQNESKAPDDGTAHRLAWATLCQALIATAEFRYVD